MNINDIRAGVMDAVRSKEFKDSVMETVANVIKERDDDFCKMGFIERKKAVQSDAFRNTETLLYNFNALEKHLENEQEYLEMAFHEKSGSIVKARKNKTEKPDDDQLLKDRMESYERSKRDYQRIKNAIETVSDHKGFSVIRLKYLSPGHPKSTYAEIAEELAGSEGFSEKLNERTVRHYNKLLIHEIAVLLFGSDAI